MKTLGVASLTAVLTAALAWGATAIANDQPTQDTRIAALETQVASLSAVAAVTPKQFKKLQADVKKLRTDANALIAVVGGCLLHDNVGIASYGSSDGSEGYVYARGQEAGLTSALDFVPQDQQPHGYFLAINPQCAPQVHPGQSLFTMARQLQSKTDNVVRTAKLTPLSKRIR